ncbi:MAG: 50S ribosomal protein L11 methyltransferase [Acidobacteriota bacterium]
MADRFERRSYLLPAEREDEVSALLWQAGTRGLEVKPAAAGEVRIEAYFLAAPEGSAPPARLASGVREVGVESLADCDWMATWREQAKPFTVGRRLLLDPREPSEPPPASGARFLLRIPARSAFGTGSHESTRLALELLEGVDLERRRVLDVGCGSGVLALAALDFGARLAVGFDVDLGAALQAGQNARLNRRAGRFFAGGVAAVEPRAGFDVALVNVIPEEISPDLTLITSRLVPGAQAIFSGILRERGRRTLADLRRRGFRRLASRTAGEWVAYRMEYRPR